MKNRLSNLLTIFLFCGFLLCTLILYLLLPKESFSENEKRYLSAYPAVSWDAVSSGVWGSEVETYLADHIPGRDFYVGLNAYFDLYTGRQSSKDIWVVDGRLVEAPTAENDAKINANMDIITSFAADIGRNIDLMLIPSAGWATGKSEYKDDEIITQIHSAASEQIHAIDMISTFRNRPELYFSTDHHWNSAGAYTAYQRYMEQLGRDYTSEEHFRKEVAAQFQGSTYSRSALWLTPSEDLELWYGSDSLIVTNGESSESHHGVFYPERLSEADKYTVFLDGNHSIVRIVNPDASGKILVIRDSYTNLLGCFLAESYGEVVLLDLRYYKQQVSQLVQEENFDTILICYSLSNFLTDTNLIWLR